MTTPPKPAPATILHDPEACPNCLAGVVHDPALPKTVGVDSAPDTPDMDGLIAAIERAQNIERGREVLIGAVFGFVLAVAFFGLLSVLT